MLFFPFDYLLFLIYFILFKLNFFIFKKIDLFNNFQFNITIFLIPQQKLLKVLKLITLLKNPNGVSLKSVAVSLDISSRTAYRYIILLEEVGFFIDKNFNNNYFIHQIKDDPSDLTFSPEESSLLRQMIESTAQRHPLKEAILQKLYIHSELEPIGENLLKARLGLLVEKLKFGIQNEVQIILKSYHSANSSEISDRLVEPLSFQENYTYLQAFEPSSQKVKAFKVERIGDIIILNKRQKYFKTSAVVNIDVFGIAGSEPVEVMLRLSLRAYLLLREEFPKAISYLFEENENYYFLGPVIGFQGVSRFILGLLDEIEVLRPESLQVHLEQKINMRILNKNGINGKNIS